jgi:hypothetical protein
MTKATNGVTILLAEQNTNIALNNNADVKEFYLGSGF